MSWVAAGIATASVVAGVESGRQAKKGAKKQARRLAPLAKTQAEIAERNNKIAERLEQLAEKMLAGEGLSAAEQNLFKRVGEVTDKALQRSTREATEQAIAFQAGTGFLKSGRTADQIRKLQLEGSEQRDRASIERERTQLQLIEQRRAQAFSLLGAAGGQAIPQFQTGLIGLPSESLNAAQLAGLSGTLGGLAGQFAGGTGGARGGASGTTAGTGTGTAGSLASQLGTQSFDNPRQGFV